jgi:hypothetical protein
MQPVFLAAGPQRRSTEIFCMTPSPQPNEKVIDNLCAGVVGGSATFKETAPPKLKETTFEKGQRRWLECRSSLWI